MLALASCGDNVVEPLDAEIIEPPPPAVLVLDMTTAQFGSVHVNSVGLPTTFTVRNIGLGESGDVTAAFGGPDWASFRLLDSTCTTLVPNATCRMEVAFAPASTGTKNAMLVVSGAPGGGVIATLAGEGTP